MPLNLHDNLFKDIGHTLHSQTHTLKSRCIQATLPIQTHTRTVLSLAEVSR
jgi:hypothetical protein